MSEYKPPPKPAPLTPKEQFQRMLDEIPRERYRRMWRRLLRMQRLKQIKKKGTAHD